MEHTLNLAEDSFSLESILNNVDNNGLAKVLTCEGVTVYVTRVEGSSLRDVRDYEGKCALLIPKTCGLFSGDEDALTRIISSLKTESKLQGVDIEYHESDAFAICRSATIENSKLTLKNTLVAPVYGYKHGGVVLSLSPFADEFDSGIAGFISANSDDIAEWKNKDKAELTNDDKSFIMAEFAKEIDEINEYLSNGLFQVYSEGDDCCHMALSSQLENIIKQEF